MSLNQRGKDARKKRGSILLLAIFFLIVLFSLAVAFFRIIPAEYHSAERSRRKIQASYAADSGVRHALEWLRLEVEANKAGVIPQTDLDTYNATYFGSSSIAWADPHKWTNDPSPISNAENKIDDDWSFASCIRVDNPAILAKVYTVESCAYFHGRPMQVARVTLQNTTFAQYALFISDWDPDFVYGMQPNGIQGPVHTNTYLRVQVPDTDFWTATKSDGSPTDPWVSGPLAKITQSGSFLGTSTDPKNETGMTADGIQYLMGNSVAKNFDLLPYDDTGASNSARYNKIVSGGRDNIRQVSRVEMPSAADELKNKAWGGDFPTSTADVKAAANGNSLLVMTDSGKANDSSGKVTGGIFITGSDTKDMLLDITPEGNQKIRVRQGKTQVPGADKTTWYADIQKYKKSVLVPAWDEPTTECKQTETVDVPVYTNVKKTRTVERQDEGHCGSHYEYVAADNGISTKIKVINVCTFDETYYVREQTGTKQKVNCIKYGPGPVIHHKAYTKWVSTDASDPDAVANGSPKKTVVSSSYPGAYSETTTGNMKTIDSWSSVVEVNDNDYNIPYHDGVKVNGVAATGPTDPILKVTDGHTVAIKNDYKDSTADYAEYTVMDGRTNGVVFSDVNINNLRGTSKGAKYDDANGNLEYQGRVIAANIETNKNINIKDSILQYYDGNGVDGDGNPLNDGKNRLVVGNESPSPDHILGLIGTNISIRPSSKSKYYDNNRTNHRERGNVGNRAFLGGDFQGGINVYAILMAGKTKNNGDVIGGFGADNSAMQNSDNLGDFNLYGGDISGVARKTQTYYGSIGSGDNNGFRLNLNYDKMAAAFLDYFPPTNQFVALRYVTYTPKDLDLRI